MAEKDITLFLEKDPEKHILYFFFNSKELKVVSKAFTFEALHQEQFHVS